MLYNLPLLSNQELQHLLISETKRLMNALQERKPFSQLGVIQDALQQIVDELDQRREDGRLAHG